MIRDLVHGQRYLGFTAGLSRSEGVARSEQKAILDPRPRPAEKCLRIRRRRRDVNRAHGVDQLPDGLPADRHALLKFRRPCHLQRVLLAVFAEGRALAAGPEVKRHVRRWDHGRKTRGVSELVRDLDLCLIAGRRQDVHIPCHQPRRAARHGGARAPRATDRPPIALDRTDVFPAARGELCRGHARDVQPRVRREHRVVRPVELRPRECRRGVAVKAHCQRLFRV